MNKLQQVRYSAAFTSQAQKLDKHIKDFDSDPNTQIRWDWQLIQNAKDAPNIFKQTHIKQQLEDNYFTSSHNGDAFYIDQLHSVVAQYSTKKQKNSEQTKTTGKYGTGFITTYILSKVIDLTGILKVQIVEDSSDEEEQTTKQELSKEQHKNKKMKHQLEQLQNQFSQMATDSYFQQFSRSTLKNKQKQQKQTIFYYKKFNIPMDRSYVDRDQELPKKIQKTEKRLTKLCMQAQYESRNNPNFDVRNYYQKTRTTQSFDTTFKYKLMDKNKYTMIEKTMQNIKYLMPYAFLFNDNLKYYEFIDKRTQNKNISFSLTKADFTQVDKNIYLFSYTVKENYNKVRQQFMSERTAYIVSYFHDGVAIAAIPVEIENDIIKIVKVDNQYPKVFKDFPLIGCYDICWNAIINSRTFYPNQKRSELMLKFYDQTNQSKVQTNWKYLGFCFNAMKCLYVFLSRFSMLGLQNLLLFSDLNVLTQTQPSFRNLTIKLIKQIVNTKFVPSRACSEKQKVLVQPCNLVFLELSKNKQQFVKNKDLYFKLSERVNNIFSFIYGDQNTILSNYYADFYQVLNIQSSYRAYLQNNKFVRFATLNDCLEEIGKMDFKNFLMKIGNAYQQKLHQIYKFLAEYNQQNYLSFNSPLDFRIFLNQKDQFKRLKKDNMMLHDIPTAYEQVANYLNINIYQNLLKKQFVAYVKSNDRRYYFDIPKMEDRILAHFRWYDKPVNTKTNQFQGLEYLQNLYLILVLFNSLPDNLIIMIKKFSAFVFQKNIQIKDIKNIKPFRKQISTDLLLLFSSWFQLYMQSLIDKDQHFKTFMTTNLVIKYQQEGYQFMKNLFSDPILYSKLQQSKYRLNWAGNFIPYNKLNLFKLNDNIDYPNEQDINILKLTNSIRVKRKNLYEVPIVFGSIYIALVHPLYDKTYLSVLGAVNYIHLFQQLKSSYQRLNPLEKITYLNYVNKIYKQYCFGVKVTPTLQQKYNTFAQEINQRNELIFNLRKSQNKLNDDVTKSFLFDLFSNEQQMASALQIYKNNNNTLFFSELCQQLGLKSSGNQIKMQQTKR